MEHNRDMPHDKLVTTEVTIDAPAAAIFELIADPSQQPLWDGNDNLVSADPGQRVHASGEVFVMHINGSEVRENHVVEFEENRLIAWRPAAPSRAPFGQLWRWELTPIDAGHTLVRHSYDWSGLPASEKGRRARAARTTPENLEASLMRLKELAEKND